MLGSGAGAVEREIGKIGNERREFSAIHREGSAGGDPGLLGVKVPFSLPPEPGLELPEPLSRDRAPAPPGPRGSPPGHGGTEQPEPRVLITR